MRPRLMARRRVEIHLGCVTPARNAPIGRAQASAYHYSIRSDTFPSPSWQLRVQPAFLFPR
jgi:hypothetical protein